MGWEQECTGDRVVGGGGINCRYRGVDGEGMSPPGCLQSKWKTIQFPVIPSSFRPASRGIRVPWEDRPWPLQEQDWKVYTSSTFSPRIIFITAYPVFLYVCKFASFLASMVIYEQLEADNLSPGRHRLQFDPQTHSIVVSGEPLHCFPRWWRFASVLCDPPRGNRKL